MKKNCRDCGIDFRIKSIKKGFADQCDICSEENENEPMRYLGFNDGSLNKSTNISFYRGTDKTVRERIMNQKARV